MDVSTIIGLAGVAGYVGAYALLQLGALDGNGITYALANVVAAGLVLISLINDFNLASAVTQVLWIAIGTVGLVLRVVRGVPEHPSVEVIAAPELTIRGRFSPPERAPIGDGIRTF